jgi:hypothetical protein
MFGHTQKYVALIFAILAALLTSGSAQAQGTDKIFAQKLVDEALAKHHDVIILAMHVTPP